MYAYIYSVYICIYIKINMHLYVSILYIHILYIPIKILISKHVFRQKVSLLLLSSTST